MRDDVIVERKRRRLLLLAPSTGFGGGIERVAAAVEANWHGPVDRIDLYQPDEVTQPEGNLRAKFRFTRRVLVTVASRRVDALIAVHVNFLPVAVSFALLRRIPVGVVAHGVEVWSPFSWWMRWLIRRCDWLLAVSSFTAAWFARRAAIDSDRVTVVPLPIDEDLSQVALGERRQTVAPDNADDLVLLTVSRLVPENRFKGHFIIAKSMPAVLAQRPRIRWVVVGHGSDLPAIQARCRAVGIDHAVEFTGRIDDEELAEAYRRADVFVLPSSADPEARPPVGEGFGLVFAEAGAFWLPSIGSSRGGGSLDFIEHGKTGLTVPPEDAVALSDAVIRLANDPELRWRLGQAARERVMSRHLPAHFALALRDACQG